MAFEVKTGVQLGQGIQKVTRKQIARICKELAQAKPDKPGKTVHEARKGLKKVRAVLRLVRREVGGKEYKRENRRFRAVAAALSPRRDAEVLTQTLKKWRGKDVEESEKHALVKLDKVVLGRYEQAFESADGDKQLRPLLKQARRKVESWPLHDLSWKDVCRGLKDNYRRVRKAYETAARQPTNDNLHQWRKRVKDLMYQLRLLGPTCPRLLGALARELKSLSEFLGDDHDLAMLEEALLKANLNAFEIQAARQHIADRRRELQSKAFELGRRLHRETPAEFASRLKHLPEGAAKSRA